MFSWLSKIKVLLNIKGLADGLIEKLKGKKTLLGLIALVLWFLIYGVPIYFPQYVWLADIALKIQAYLQSAGIILDDSLLTGGAGVTVIGLIDKIRRIFYPDDKD